MKFISGLYHDGHQLLVMTKDELHRRLRRRAKDAQHWVRVKVGQVKAGKFFQGPK